MRHLAFLQKMTRMFEHKLQFAASSRIAFLFDVHISCTVHSVSILCTRVEASPFAYNFVIIISKAFAPFFQHICRECFLHNAKAYTYCSSPNTFLSASQLSTFSPLSYTVFPTPSRLMLKRI